MKLTVNETFSFEVSKRSRMTSYLNAFSAAPLEHHLVNYKFSLEVYLKGIKEASDCDESCRVDDDS